MTDVFKYTERDYASFRSQIIDHVRSRFPDWSADPSDFATVLAESMAYLGDMMSYYVDRAAKEASILTATGPGNVHAHARLLGYYPGLRMSAGCKVRFTNTGSTEIVVPRGTMVSAQSGVILYETQADCTVPANGSEVADVLEGTSGSATIGTADGSGGLQLRIQDTMLDGRPGTMFASTYDPTTGHTDYWTYTETLLDAQPGEYVFTIRTDSDGTHSLVFGDGVSGRAPENGRVVSLHYRTTLGSGGNAPGAILNRVVVSWDSNNLVDYSKLEVASVGSPSGGADEESLDSIRRGAVNLVRAQRRAVTASDYESLLLADSSVLDASCSSAHWSRPTVWFLPWEENAIYDDDVRRANEARLTSRVQEMSMVGVEPTCRTASVLRYYAEVEAIVRPGVDSEYAIAAVTELLTNRFGYSHARIGERITSEDIMAEIRDNVPRSVVSFARLTDLKLLAGDLSVMDVVPAVNEAPVITGVNVMVSLGLPSGRRR